MYRDEDQRNFARRLRGAPTTAERRLWRLLCAKQLGYKFRRQAALGPYVVDFICFEKKLVVELDGPQHEVDQADYDARRSEWLIARGFSVLRFRNHELDENIHAVVEAIRVALKDVEPSVPLTPSPPLPSRGRGPEEASNI